jgi:ATP-dependent RNA helicase RhlE
MLPHVVNFELPNVPEDYVHRIGRTGRAGSSGAAISLVDKEELSYLRDIERLIKREIPKVAIDSFVPPTNIAEEAPRAPRPPQGQRRNSGPRTAGTGNRNQPPREGQARDGQGPKPRQQREPRNPQQREQQPRTGSQPRNSQTSAKPRPPQKPADQQHLSEAARHQAMPQPALFSPKPGVRRGR